MTTSTLIARLMGPVLLAIGIGIALGLGVEGDTSSAMIKEFVGSKALIYITGLLGSCCWVSPSSTRTICGSRIGGRSSPSSAGSPSCAASPASCSPSSVQAMGERMLASSVGLLTAAAITVALGAVLTFMGYEDLWAEHRHPRRAAASTGARSSAKRPRRR